MSSCVRSAKLGPLHQTGALYEFYPPAADKKLNPPGEWNTSRIVLRGTHVEHWLNGAKVIEIDRSSEAFRSAVAGSKFKDIAGFGQIRRGLDNLWYAEQPGERDKLAAIQRVILAHEAVAEYKAAVNGDG